MNTRYFQEALSFRHVSMSPYGNSGALAAVSGSKEDSRHKLCLISNSRFTRTRGERACGRVCEVVTGQLRNCTEKQIDGGSLSQIIINVIKRVPWQV